MEQQLHLGVEFWKAFEIAPNILAADEISIDLHMEIHGERNSNKTHELFPDQQKELQDVVKMLPTFEKHAIKLVEVAVPVKKPFRSNVH